LLYPDIKGIISGYNKIIVIQTRVIIILLTQKKRNIIISYYTGIQFNSIYGNIENDRRECYQAAANFIKDYGNQLFIRYIESLIERIEDIHSHSILDNMEKNLFCEGITEGTFPQKETLLEICRI
jgi:predicted patatin/cPLA2 family phospholipase